MEVTGNFMNLIDLIIENSAHRQVPGHEPSNEQEQAVSTVYILTV